MNKWFWKGKSKWRLIFRVDHYDWRAVSSSVPSWTVLSRQQSTLKLYRGYVVAGKAPWWNKSYTKPSKSSYFSFEIPVPWLWGEWFPKLRRSGDDIRYTFDRVQKCSVLGNICQAAPDRQAKVLIQGQMPLCWVNSHTTDREACATWALPHLDNSPL